MPNQYHNGGVWPWVGGLYVAALVRAGLMERAHSALHQLAEANKYGRDHEWEFNEWLHGITGEPKGSPDQLWSAGMYLYAYMCVKRCCEPVFSSIIPEKCQGIHNIITLDDE
jgi:glycogen debranching enzyme